jgi:hypothetical protein
MIMLVTLSLLTIGIKLPREAQAEPQDLEFQPTQSVVDAARRNREQKKNAAVPAKVITNDDLDKGHTKHPPDGKNIDALAARQTESPNASFLDAAEVHPQVATLTSDHPVSNSKESEEADAEDAEIAKLKAELASAQNALKWQQRELLLDQNTIYSNPAYTTTHVGKAELDSAKLQIEQTQQEIDRLKEPLANLEWWRWRRLQAGRSENGSTDENYKSVPPSALVLPQP